MVEFNIIDCKNYIYIAGSNIYWKSIDYYLFDGKVAEPTNNEDWFRLDKIPTSVSEKADDKYTNQRYELKTGYTPNSMIPQSIPLNQEEEYKEVLGLYTYKYDLVPGGYEEIEFSIKKIYEREDFTFIPNKYDADTDLITQIEYPEVAYQDKPCRIDSVHMLRIIRQYVKEHIDTSVASIASDYDFHFKVVKKIALSNPYSIKVDTNNSIMNKRRKPRWVDKMISTKEVTIIEFQDKPSRDYDSMVAPSIVGKNYKDLQDKIENYLSDLMTQINKKYCECPHCKGWGIVEVE